MDKGSRSSGWTEEPANGGAAFSKTTALVLDHIVAQLSAGAYQPGQKLNAARLCRELSLSKAPVREALHVLAGEGILGMSTNRGAFIRRLDKADLLHLWHAFALGLGAEFRFAAAGIARENMIARLDAAMQAIRTTPPGPAFVRALHDYHAVASLCVINPYIVSAQTRRLGEFWIPFILANFPIEHYLSAYVANYQRIHDCLVAGDGRSAESCFHYHARWSSSIISGARPDAGEPWVDDAIV